MAEQKVSDLDANEEAAVDRGGGQQAAAGRLPRDGVAVHRDVASTKSSYFLVSILLCKIECIFYVYDVSSLSN